MRHVLMAAMAALLLQACATQPAPQADAKPQAAETAKAEEEPAKAKKCYEVPSTGSRVKRPCGTSTGAITTQGAPAGTPR
ncbi:MAG: hypothetical protein ACRES8_03590 [Nevskiaceae bacterium]